MAASDILTIWLCLFSIHIIGGYSLRCFNCTNVNDVTLCKNTTECGLRENCFIERYKNLPYASFELGCLEDQNCPSQRPSFTLVGRNLQHKEVPMCRRCCTTDNCNAQHCDFPLSVSPTTTPFPCADQVINCPRLNSTLHVCTDLQNARKLCRKFCNLCNLADGAWNVWSDWSECSVSCGRGTMSRMRMCNNPEPAHGGLDCTGNRTETYWCHPRLCPVHGGWAAWQSWDSCTSKCGLGLAKRHRTCTSPTPTLFGNNCFGDNVESKLCNGTACFQATPSPSPNPASSCVDAFSGCDLLNSSVSICADQEKARKLCKHFCGLCSIADGGWSAWSNWAGCTVTCGNGTMSRSRSCTNPSPANGGLQCQGQDHQMETCFQHVCPVHGGWAMWTSWTDCSTTCGTGLSSRRRECTNPTPSLTGAYCFGDSTEYTLCEIRSCSVDGQWSTWQGWSTCSSTCGLGLRSRQRSCDNPLPDSGGKACSGINIENEICETRTCAVSGNWGTWGSWSTCSNTCGVGLRHRRRLCNNPRPAAGGDYCDGDALEHETCQVQKCEGRVAFQVSYPTSPRKGILRFTRISLNVGGGYSASTGAFTAPVSGLYLFSVSAYASNSHDYAYVDFRKNGAIVEQYFTGSSSSGHSSASSETIIIELHKNDRITISSNYALYSAYETSFSGVLLIQ